MNLSRSEIIIIAIISLVALVALYYLFSFRKMEQDIMNAPVPDISNVKLDLTPYKQ